MIYLQYAGIFVVAFFIGVLFAKRYFDWRNRSLADFIVRHPEILAKMAKEGS